MQLKIQITDNKYSDQQCLKSNGSFFLNQPIDHSVPTGFHRSIRWQASFHLERNFLISERWIKSWCCWWRWEKKMWRSSWKWHECVSAAPCSLELRALYLSSNNPSTLPCKNIFKSSSWFNVWHLHHPQNFWSLLITTSCTAPPQPDPFLLFSRILCLLVSSSPPPHVLSIFHPENSQWSTLNFQKENFPLRLPSANVQCSRTWMPARAATPQADISTVSGRTTGNLFKCCK